MSDAEVGAEAGAEVDAEATRRKRSHLGALCAECIGETLEPRERFEFEKAVQSFLMEWAK